jgi:hypothetical protein
MDPENKEDTRLDKEAGQSPSEFGKVIDALHEQHKLPSLRSYQGDMAEFIKSKDESVISIALKEKKKKEEKEEKRIEEEMEKEKLEPLSKKSSGAFKMNLTMLLVSVLLIAGGVLASFYIFQFVNKAPQVKVVAKEEIIPYNNLLSIKDVTNTNLGSELRKLSPANGINIVEISDSKNQTFQKAKDFFDFLKITLPPALERTLKDKYVIGIMSQNKNDFYFMVITVNDFGQAFSAMLDWENSMDKDLYFINAEISTSTKDTFSWKDLIIKNKDTRGLVNQRNQEKIAYTFLDKNTIFITNNLSSIGEMSVAFTSRSIAR